MILILEGPDGGGKTTLRQRLKGHGYSYIPYVPREWPYQYEMYRKLFMSIDKTKNVVMDRCFISEIVYRIVKSDAPPNINLREIGTLLDMTDVTIINCNTDTMFNDCIARGDDNITDAAEHSRITEIYEILFNIIAKFTNAKVIKYNWQKDNFYDLLTKIKN